MIYCGTYMIHSRRRAGEVHFDDNNMCYVARIKNLRVYQLGFSERVSEPLAPLPKTTTGVIPTDLIRVIDEFIPEFEEISWKVQTTHSREGHEYPTDINMCHPGTASYDDDGNWVDAEYDVDYVIEKAKDFVEGDFIGWGYAEVRVIDHPTCTRTYKNVDDEILERLRQKIEKSVHPFVKSMTMRFEGFTFEITSEYEPSSNELVFDYSLLGV